MKGKIGGPWRRSYRRHCPSFGLTMDEPPFIDKQQNYSVCQEQYQPLTT